MESRRGRTTRPGHVDDRARLGARAETLALRWLRRQGLELVARNFRCRYGEIDLLMQDGGMLVVIEVRCRAGASLTSAAQTVDTRKQRRLMRTALAFVAGHRAYEASPLRFDVIGIDGDPGRRSCPEWIRDAFRPP